MKLADLISADNNLLSILQRLGIRLGFGEATMEEICKRYGLSTEVFLAICNIYSFRNFQPETENLHKEDVVCITNYLRVSHAYYKDVCLPKIHNSIHGLVKELSDINRTLIDKFYDDYDSEVINHFAYEENVVFPYIESLLGKGTYAAGEYHISTFEEGHCNIGEKLCDLKNIIIKYLPQECSTSLTFEILADISAVESDLRRHSQIENKLLVPLVAKLEKENGKEG